MKNNLKILLGGLIVSTFVFSQQPTDLSFPLLSTQTSTCNILGTRLYENISSNTMSHKLIPGVYLINFYNQDQKFSTKIIVK